MSRKNLIWILWPSFIVAGVAEGLFFTAFDPQDLILFGEPVIWSRTAVYSVGFFAFWAVTAVTSALTCFLQRASGEINRRQLEQADQSSEYPRREERSGE